uniref:Slc6a-16 n=1 Tax=Schmidtea mediterranea TaxID=79327 RepID=A0A0H3YIV3_SCHMD|nr:slc6a-16 [Schmidtea mediterranea]
MDDEEIEYEEFLERDHNEAFTSNADYDFGEMDETPLPFYLKQMFSNHEGESKTIVIDHGDKERGNWETQFECLLSCVGYAVGIGNLWRFPAKVYKGGGGSFLIIYFIFFFLFGGPMMMLEMSLGQFCSQGCSRAFEFCPALQGIGYTITILSFVILLEYTIAIARCVLYLGESFRVVLPWTVCTNSFNTPRCINSSKFTGNFSNSSYESSVDEFWYYFVTGEQRLNGSFMELTDPLGAPRLPTVICVFVVLCLGALTIMFGVKVSGKIMYVTVMFPYISILQFLFLGCSLPGAANGIKFYLYPDVSKFFDPSVYIMVLEQLMLSCGIGAGGLITMSSFNRFRDRIHRNVIIVMLTDFLTSIISGLAIFPVIGYISLQRGKDISDLFKDESNLFFLTYPEALSTISSPNMWSVLFMMMAITLGIDTIFVLLETIIMGISDLYTKLYTKNNKIRLTIFVCLTIFICGMILTTPGGFNLSLLLQNTIVPIVLIFTIIMESISVCCIYGIRNFREDIKMMTGENLGTFWIASIWVFIPICAIMLMLTAIADTDTIVRRGIPFPTWTKYFSWFIIVLIISPIYLGALYVLIKTKIRNPELGLRKYLKLCFKPPPNWGPKSKRYWIQSTFYSKKLIKYKDHPKLLSSLLKHEDISKLIMKNEQQTLKFKIQD